MQAQTRNPDGTWTLDDRRSGDLHIAAIDVSLSLDAIYEAVDFSG